MPSMGQTTSSDGWEDVQFTLRVDPALQTVDVADVTAIDHDRDETAHRAVLVEELILKTLIFTGEPLEDAADRLWRVRQLDAATTDQRPQRRIKSYLHGLLEVRSVLG